MDPTLDFMWKWIFLYKGKQMKDPRNEPDFTHVYFLTLKKVHKREARLICITD